MKIVMVAKNKELVLKVGRVSFVEIYSTHIIRVYVITVLLNINHRPVFYLNPTKFRRLGVTLR
jgi:hypothetical protein